MATLVVSLAGPEGSGSENTQLPCLAVALRALQMFYHNAHNLTNGPSFNADHAFFNASYHEVEDHYDSVAEKMIGTEGFRDLLGVTAKALCLLQKLGVCKSAEDYYKYAQPLEQRINDLCCSIDAQDKSAGIKNLVGGICDSSESRSYKIAQRLHTLTKTK